MVTGARIPRPMGTASCGVGPHMAQHPSECLDQEGHGQGEREAARCALRSVKRQHATGTSSTERGRAAEEAASAAASSTRGMVTLIILTTPCTRLRPLSPPLQPLLPHAITFFCANRRVTFPAAKIHELSMLLFAERPMRGVLSLALLISLPHGADLEPAPEPWVDIISPEPAQLFVEGEFASLALRFRVHGLELGDGKGVAHVYVIRHAMSYGGDAFRGREWHRAAPDARVREAEASIPLDHLELGLGLHQVRVHLVEEAQGQEREVAESAVFFEIRLPALPPADLIWGAPRPVPDEVASNAFDDKVWLPSEGGQGGDVPAEAVEETVERVWREYVQLHAHMMRPSTPVHNRRLLILDQTAGGLGNRLGSVISGLLLAMLSGRALLVHWDLCDYLINGDESSGGIRWQFPSLDHIRAELGPEAVQGVEYVDMGELAPFLTCQRYTVSTEAGGSVDDSSPSDLAVVGTLKIKNPHYYVPLVVSNPHYRRRIFDTLGAQPAIVPLSPDLGSSEAHPGPFKAVLTRGYWQERGRRTSS